MVAADMCELPISEISSYVQRWTIRARVTSKSAMRTFSKGANGGGKVFSVELLDTHGGEIRATFFNDAVDRYMDTLQRGKCYTFSRGTTRIANQQYTTCKHRYELVFDKAAEIVEVADDKDIQAVKLSIVDLREVQSKTLPCTVDLCGVVTSAAPTLSFTSKDGRDLVKRNITIADDTATSLTFTLWGDRAKQEDSVFEGHPVVGLKGVVIKEWNGGRSGSLSESGSMVFAPSIPEAEKLRQWWSQGGSAQSLTALSMDGVAGGGSRRAAKAMDLTDMRQLSDKVLEEPELASIVCRLALVQLQKKGEVQPLYYNACQEVREGKSLPCNRRLDSGGFCASCNRAGKAAPRFNLRCRFADFGDNAWLTTFHEAAQVVAGLTSEQAQDLEQGEGGREALDAAITRKYFSQPMQVTVRAKLDSYNGETRTNITCIDARPVRRGEHGRAMLQEIREKLLN